jgi:hypothetical protein
MILLVILAVVVYLIYLAAKAGALQGQDKMQGIKERRAMRKAGRNPQPESRK